MKEQSIIEIEESSEETFYFNMETDSLIETNLHKIPLKKLYQQLETQEDGLNTLDAKEKRNVHGLNKIEPPNACPMWLCCLLPCLKNDATLRKFEECVPSSSYVKRNRNWIKLDSVSIVPGDIVRISEGDRVPADIRIVSTSSAGCKFDVSTIMGRSPLILCDSKSCADSYLDSPNIALTGYLCQSGSCVGVVLTTGKKTILQQLIKNGSWPPQ